MIRRNFYDVKNFIETNGYRIENQEYENNETRLLIFDDFGYKYDTSFGNFQIQMRRKNRLRPFDINNKYTAANIKTWMEENSKDLCFIECEYIGAREKSLIIKCNKCLEKFDTCWDDVHFGKGCPFCSGKRVNLTNNLLYLRPDICVDWDYDSNTKLPENITECSSYNASWVCHKCGHKWETMVASRTNLNSGCAKCMKKEAIKSYKRNVISKTGNLIETHSKLVDEWHPVLNGNKTPKDYSYGSDEKIMWICPKGHSDYPATIYNRARNNEGCPKCRESKGEKTIERFLKENGLNFIRQYRFDDCKYKQKLPFDFYIVDLNICIEYDGEFHYKAPYQLLFDIQKVDEYLREVKLRDAIKTNYCLDNQIKLIRIPYWEMKNIEKILSEELNIG
jgi:hypothetical protein